MLQEVDPEIGVSQYALQTARDSQAEHREGLSLLQHMGMDKWGGANDVVKAIAKETMENLWQSVIKFTDCKIDAVDSEGVNQGRLYGMIATLKRFKFDRSHKAALVIWRGDNPEYRYINENTVHLLEKMLDHGIVKDVNLGHGDYQDSDKALMFAGQHWMKMEIMFIEDKKIGPFDNIPRGGGFFPFILTEQVDDRLQLMKFGIFCEFKAENYKTSRKFFLAPTC
jgi:hypothetical protein